jgi:hypothetical protein
MMKFKHNKKRNTAFVYEVLIVELSKASMVNDNNKKNKSVSLLKEYFSKGRELKKDLDIYKFNKEYDQVLEKEQKKLLEKYITSCHDDGLEFKIYLYEEIDRLKKIINKKINKDKTQLSDRLQKIVDRMSVYNERTLDRTLISEVAKVQSLVREII